MMEVTYNIYLVLFSALIAIFASYVTLELASEVTMAQGSDRKFWLGLGAIAMGMGIWAMHFIAMLAFSIKLYIAYDLFTVLLSLLAAIAGCWQGLFIVSRRKVHWTLLLAGASSMGIAIALMHYIGMAGMRMRADISYKPLLFVVSIVIAIVVSLAAIQISSIFRTKTGGRAFWGKIISAVVMGFAVLSMHYTGMAAAIITPNHNKVVDIISSLDNTTIAFGIGIATFVILGLTLMVVFSSEESRYIQ